MHMPKEENTSALLAVQESLSAQELARPIRPHSQQSTRGRSLPPHPFGCVARGDGHRQHDPRSNVWLLERQLAQRLLVIVWAECGHRFADLPPQPLLLSFRARFPDKRQSISARLADTSRGSAFILLPPLPVNPRGRARTSCGGHGLSPGARLCGAVRLDWRRDNGRGRHIATTYGTHVSHALVTFPQQFLVSALTPPPACPVLVAPQRRCTRLCAPRGCSRSYPTACVDRRMRHAQRNGGRG